MADLLLSLNNVIMFWVVVGFIKKTTATTSGLENVLDHLLVFAVLKRYEVYGESIETSHEQFYVQQHLCLRRWGCN